MRDSTRLLATLIIWTAFTAIMGIIGGALVTADATLEWGGWLVVLLIVLAIVGAVISGTQAVWNFRPDTSEEQRTSAAKAKRTGQDRVRRLVESLDDDEIYDLESLLLAREENPETAAHRRP